MLSGSDISDSLPQSLKSWKRIDVLRDPEWWKPWDILRCFFKEAGYELYDAHPHGQYSTPKSGKPPSLESFGLHGDRSNFIGDFRPIAHVFAARDRENRDVVIKLVSKGNDGRTERQILQLLNSEPLRSDPANPTVHVVEFIEFRDYFFAVVPCCDRCDERSFLSASECLDFAEQVLEGLSFLHEHRIAHLDISNENILVNHRGELPPIAIYGDPYEPPIPISPPLEWRSTFPVRYLFIDFGCSAYFKEDAKLSECTVDPFPEGREQRAPETEGRKAYNPFAADVYQMSRLLYGWFSDIADNEPCLLKLFQDMSSYNPSRRITAASALSRLRILRHIIPNDIRERHLLWFPLIPRSHLIMFRDILECSQWALAFEFTWAILKTKFRTLWGKERPKA